jgi:hypothetical protein
MTKKSLALPLLPIPFRKTVVLHKHKSHTLRRSSAALTLPARSRARTQIKLLLIALQEDLLAQDKGMH